MQGVTRKEFRKPKYLESQQKVFLKLIKIYLKQNYHLQKAMENSYSIKESLFTVPNESKLSLRISTNTSSATVSDPQILKLNPNEHKV